MNISTSILQIFSYRFLSFLEPLTCNLRDIQVVLYGCGSQWDMVPLPPFTSTPPAPPPPLRFTPESCYGEGGNPPFFSQSSIWPSPKMLSQNCPTFLASSDTCIDEMHQQTKKQSGCRVKIRLKSQRFLPLPFSFLFPVTNNTEVNWSRKMCCKVQRACRPKQQSNILNSSALLYYKELLPQEESLLGCFRSK